jgi:MFS family permease
MARSVAHGPVDRTPSPGQGDVWSPVAAVPLASARGSYVWFNRWGVFAATCLVFAFLNFSTFNSLGVVLYTMVAELHWSMTAAGFNFSLLGAACGLSSPLPALTMRRFGSRATIAVGALLLVAGFFLASASESLLQFYLAMVLLGLGYSFAGVVPAVYLITGWFGQRSARMIGIYYMLGALGATVGPPLAVITLRVGGGWRGHWEIMALASAIIGVVCLSLIRDAAPSEELAKTPIDDEYGVAIVPHSATATEWRPREAMMTAQFLIVTASQTLTMASVTTNSSVAVAHLVHYGATPATAALFLSVIALTATLIKGVVGRVCELLDAGTVLAVGLALQAAGNVLLSTGGAGYLPYLAAVVLGVGWGCSFVAGTVVLLNYFGHQTGSQILSFVWFLASAAALGPLTAGILADRFGSFTIIFDFFAAMFVALAVPIYLMRAPVKATPVDAAIAARGGPLQ